MNEQRFLRFAVLLALAGLWWAPQALAAAAQLTSSFYILQQDTTTFMAQLIRCDNSGSYAGDGTGPQSGETCEAGDWSRAINCTGKTNLSARYFEYGAGSGQAKIWDCTESLGVSDDLTQDPSGSPGASDPAPLCVDLTAGASVTLDGTTTTLMNLDGQELHYIVGEIHACTGNCDSTLVVSCGR